MTISTTHNKISYVADGVQTVFAYDFEVNDPAALIVTFDNVVQGSGYSVDGIDDPTGGNVTFDTEPAAAVVVKFTRTESLNQLTDYKPYDPFPAETHEEALDKLTKIDQQQQEQLDRAVLGDPDGAAADFTYNFGTAVERAGKLWAFDATGFTVIALDQAEDLAYRWANTDENQVVAKVGGLDRYSAYHWSLKAAAISEWGLSAAGDIYVGDGSLVPATVLPVGASTDGDTLVRDDASPVKVKWATLAANLPAILAGDALKAPVVKADETGYELKVITSDILRGAGGWAEDDESGGPAIQTANKTNHSKQLVMRYEVPTISVEYMAWMNGSELVYIKEFKTISYNFKIWMGPAVSGTGNVRLRVDVYTYQDNINMNKTLPDLTSTTADIPLTDSAVRTEIVIANLLPATPAADEEQLLAISISRIDAAVSEFDQALDIYAASLEVAT